MIRRPEGKGSVRAAVAPPAGGSGRKKTGDIFLDAGLIRSKDRDLALAIQEKSGTEGNRRLFGRILSDLGLVTPVDSYCTLVRHGRLRSLEEALVEKKLLSPSALQSVFDRAASTSVPLISFLFRHGKMPKDALIQVLDDLFHVPFRSVGDFVLDETGRAALSGVIDRKTAARHLCVPLKRDGSEMTVGMTDPSNFLLLRRLDRTCPQYRFSPVFISFAGFTWFYRLLYGKDVKTEAFGSDASAVISDPLSQTEEIFSFFDRYERLRRAGVGDEADMPDDPDRREQFVAFIRRHHERIASRAGCRTVSFSLEPSREKVLILARPEREVP